MKKPTDSLNEMITSANQHAYNALEKIIQEHGGTFTFNVYIPFYTDEKGLEYGEVWGEATITLQDMDKPYVTLNIAAERRVFQIQMLISKLLDASIVGDPDGTAEYLEISN